jgi:hypothetical protein
MTISVADTATLVIEQLNIQSDASTPPTTGMVEDYVRRGAQRLIAALQPVFLDTGSLSSMVATVSGKAQIIHVEVGLHALTLNEWRETDTGFKITDYSIAQASDTYYVWYTKSIAIADNATTVDLDCIHGGNWGRETIITYAEMLCKERLSATDAANQNVHWSGYRVLERRHEMQMAELRARRDSDIGILGARVQQRIQFGKGAWRESAVSGFRNESDFTDRTTGEH